MFAVDNTFAMQPTVSPQQDAEMVLFDSRANETLPIRITRIFDIRQVHNSETELRLSFDVPAGVSAQELQVYIEHDKQEHPDIYRLRVGGVHWPHAKTFPLNAESVDLHQVEAVLKNDVLEVIAPKRRNSSTNALFAMAVEALQSLALSVSNSSWNTDLIFREVSVKDSSSMQSS